MPSLLFWVTCYCYSNMANQQLYNQNHRVCHVTMSAVYTDVVNHKAKHIKNWCFDVFCVRICLPQQNKQYSYIWLVTKSIANLKFHFQHYAISIHHTLINGPSMFLSSWANWHTLQMSIQFTVNVSQSKQEYQLKHVFQYI